MSNFVISIQAVAPMFFMMLVGTIVRKNKLLNDLELVHVNNMIFRVLFPMLMFTNIYDSAISEIVNLKLIVFGVVSIFIIYILSMLIVVHIEKNNASRGAMIQAIYRSNVVIMGSR